MKKYLFLAATLLIAASGLWAKTPIIGISGYTEDGQCHVNMTYVNSVRKAGGGQVPHIFRSFKHMSICSYVQYMLLFSICQ